MRVAINYSGHPLSRQARATLQSEFDNIVQAEPITFDFSGNIDDQLRAICEGTIESLGADTAVTIVPPGQSTLAILLVSYIHGIIGHFPKICYLELGPEGLYLPRSEFEINPQATRAAGRVFRTKRFP